MNDLRSKRYVAPVVKVLTLCEEFIITSVGIEWDSTWDTTWNSNKVGE